MWKFIRWRNESLGWIRKRFYVSALSIFIGMILILFTKDQKFTSSTMNIQ